MVAGVENCIFMVGNYVKMVIIGYLRYDPIGERDLFSGWSVQKCTYSSNRYSLFPFCVLEDR